MIIKNWMKRDPVTVSSDTRISEVQTIIDRHKLRYIPVVDNGVLRGILRRKDIYEAATFVTASQNVHELNYFHNRLKVKDLMIRMPKTIQANEPVDSAMKKSATWRARFLPVMDGKSLVGTLSYEELFEAFSQVLGISENWVGITLEDVEIKKGTMRKIIEDIEEVDGVIHSLFTLKQPETEKRKVIVRLESTNIREIVNHLREKGYSVMEAEDISNNKH